jgi:hypothetical protein
VPPRHADAADAEHLAVTERQAPARQLQQRGLAWTVLAVPSRTRTVGRRCRSWARLRTRRSTWAFAVRVGAFDGRDPEKGVFARRRIAAALTPNGRFLVDGGDPLLEVDLQRPG